MDAPTSSLEKFEAIYREWEGKTDLRADIERHLNERSRYHRILEGALSELPPGARAIELGCGTAIDSYILAQRHPRIVFFGVDISQGSITLVRRLGKETGQRLFLARSDVFRLPFPAGAFSLIFHQGLVEHFPQAEGMMREQTRLLAPGGRVVISVPQTLSGYTVMKNLRIRAGAWPWGWERSFMAGALEALGRRAGLVPLERGGEGYWRSWAEPAWVLRDLYGKLHRRNPLRASAPFAGLHRLWEGATSRLEEALGHRFCKNLIVVFRKAEEGEEV